MAFTPRLAFIKIRSAILAERPIWRLLKVSLVRNEIYWHQCDVASKESAYRGTK